MRKFFCLTFPSLLVGGWVGPPKRLKESQPQRRLADASAAEGGLSAGAASMAWESQPEASKVRSGPRAVKQQNPWFSRELVNYPIWK